MSAKSSIQHEDWDGLLNSARDGDDAALNLVWQQVRGFLLLTANDIGAGLGQKLDASDIVQQSLMEAHVDFSSFRGRSENEFRAWLAKLVQRNLIDAGRKFQDTKQRDIRRERPIQSDEFEGEDKTPSSLYQRQEVDAELLREIARLPERSQQLLELRHGNGMAHADIAKELGITEAASRKLWSRTVEELKQRLTSQNETPTRRISKDS